jgi:hypothetical protein
VPEEGMISSRRLAMQGHARGHRASDVRFERQVARSWRVCPASRAWAGVPRISHFRGDSAGAQERNGGS